MLNQITSSNTITRRQKVLGTWKTATIDLIWSSELCVEWQGKGEEWTTSDHCIIATTLPIATPATCNREGWKIDWKAVGKSIDKWPDEQPIPLGHAYSELTNYIKLHWRKPIRLSPYSKPWWDDEVTAGRKHFHETAKKSQKAANEGAPDAWQPWAHAKHVFQRLIRRKKIEHWNNFIEECNVSDPWAAVRTAKDPFRLRSTMKTMKDGSTPLKTNKEICNALCQYNFGSSIQTNTNPEARTTEGVSQHAQQVIYTSSELNDMIKQVDKALNTTKNSSAPGPDGINYMLLKKLLPTPLGKAILRNVAHHLLQGTLPAEWKEMRVVMIPKPGKDHTQVKNWRPIVLAQTVGKLWDKVVAEGLQRDGPLHWGQMGGRKNHSAIDNILWLTGKAQHAINLRGQARMLCFDVKSAFQSVRLDPIVKLLSSSTQAKRWIPHVRQFLTKRNFEIWWDERNRGNV